MRAGGIWLIAGICLYSLRLSAQISFEARIVDSLTQKPVAFSAVGIKGTSRGCLSNEDGVFKLQGVLPSDTLVISNVTYKKRQIPVTNVLSNPSIFITAFERPLQEMVIYSNNTALYDLFELCRKQLSTSKKTQSKLYFVLESEIGQQPVELMECYYNARFDNSGFEDLGFKNGRVALAPYADRYFVNRNTSKAISFLSLTNASERMPAVPFQLSKRQLRKNFRLTLKSTVAGLNPLYCIGFEPVINDGTSFSGEAWIEKNTGILRKIHLQIDSTNTHPFIPFAENYARIEGVSMQITKSFSDVNKEVRPEYLYFNYQVNYHHLHNTVLAAANADTTFRVNCQGVMYFYDYNQLFSLPYFTYDPEAEDYRKITSLTYNDWFWSSNNLLEYSNERKKKILYFKNKGLLINYRNTSLTAQKFKPGFFENNYIQWSGKKRLSLKKDGIKNDTLADTYRNQQFLSQRYKLSAQIFLDINPSGDTLQHFSTTLLDVYDSFYNLQEDPATNCFMNIYFDLVEIERRKMEESMAKNKLKLPEMDALYKITLKSVEQMSNDYFSKVSRGKNLNELEKWNFIVKQNLGIDNFEIFGLSIKNK